MKTIFTLFSFLIFSSISGFAQIVFSSDWKSEADVKVFVTEWKSEADLIVYSTEWKSEAGQNNGI